MTGRRADDREAFGVTDLDERNRSNIQRPRHGLKGKTSPSNSATSVIELVGIYNFPRNMST